MLALTQRYQVPVTLLFLAATLKLVNKNLLVYAMSVSGKFFW